MVSPFLLLLMPMPLAGLLLASLSARAQCRAPWLNQLYRQPYNGGSWSSHQELTCCVQQRQQSGLRCGYAPLGANRQACSIQARAVVAPGSH